MSMALTKASSLLERLVLAAAAGIVTDWLTCSTHSRSKIKREVTPTQSTCSYKGKTVRSLPCYIRTLVDACPIINLT